MHRTVALIGAATIPYRARSLRLPLDGVAARRGLRGKIAFAWPTARVIHDDPPRNGPRIIPDRSAVRRRLQGQLLFGAWRERAFVFFFLFARCSHTNLTVCLWLPPVGLRNAACSPTGLV